MPSTFLAAELQIVQACPSWVQTIYPKYSRNDSIFSPGYPGNYHSLQSCQWRIVAPFGQRVLIYFTEFDVEYCLGCSCDSVEIYDGTYLVDDTRLSKSCGSSLPAPVYSTGRNIFMNFSSDWSSSGAGFVAHYRVLNSSSESLVRQGGSQALIVWRKENATSSELCQESSSGPRPSPAHFQPFSPSPFVLSQISPLISSLNRSLIIISWSLLQEHLEASPSSTVEMLGLSPSPRMT
ncbi:Tumor necrosis factor-inducible gene 6 protein [Stylophora pistillata]|uniref:Tumor necrosis factor-inducible gene 6 protein n=1 Tax=Stylophora pistillata TaxID=50429 RepID=A0A2B4R4I5_STYPI|nr:Tumor necrosis factor-inducible gene 6 protein [Stylophora pistillata]